MNLGTPELLIVLLVIGLIVLAWAVPIWAIVHAAGTPDPAWSAVGSSRVMGITLILVGMFLSPLGFILAIVYLTAIRPKLDQAAVTT